MKLSDDDIREIVTRAEALQRSEGGPGTDAEALVLASDELGISRGAMQRAVQERLQARFNPQAGDIVFARSTDDRFYAAEVVDQAGYSFTVRFLRGGERVLPVDDVRPPPFLPGERVMCPWPDWGDAAGTVVSYNADRQTLTVSNGWHKTRVPVRNVWLAPDRKPSSSRSRIYAAIFSAGAAVGAAAGALLMWFLA